MKKVIYCVLLLLPILGQAQTQKILDVTSQSMPDEKGEIAIQTDDHNIMTAVSFTSEMIDQKTVRYSAKDLLKDKISVASKSSVDILSVQLSQTEPTRYTVILTYLYKFKLINRVYKTKKFVAFYSAPDNRYLVLDHESQKMISRLHFIVNYNNQGREVGIENIETL